MDCIRVYTLSLLKYGVGNYLDSGVKYRWRISQIKRSQQFVKLTDRLAAGEGLAPKGEQRATCRIGHPGGDAPPVFGGFDEQLALSPLRVELNCSHLSTEERM